MVLVDIIKTLQDYDHYGAGKYVEIAKGKNEFITGLRDLKTKIRRQWQSRKP